MAQPPPAQRLHPELEAAFGDHSDSVLLCWVVQEVSKAGERQKRVLLVTRGFIFVCELNGDICRVYRLVDVAAVDVRHPAAGGPVEVLISPHSSTEEHSVLVLLRDDRRNSPPGCCPERLCTVLHAARAAAGADHPLSVGHLPPSSPAFRDGARQRLPDGRYDDVNSKMQRWQQMPQSPAQSARNAHSGAKSPAPLPPQQPAPRHAEPAAAHATVSSAQADEGAASVEVRVAGKAPGMDLGMEVNSSMELLSVDRGGLAARAGLERLLGWQLTHVDAVPVSHPVAAHAVARNSQDPVLTFVPPHAADRAPPEWETWRTASPSSAALQHTVVSLCRPGATHRGRPPRPVSPPFVRPLPAGRWAGVGGSPPPPPPAAAPPPLATAAPPLVTALSVAAQSQPAGGSASRGDGSHARPLSNLAPLDPVWQPRGGAAAPATAPATADPAAAESCGPERIVVRCRVPAKG